MLLILLGKGFKDRWYMRNQLKEDTAQRQMTMDYELFREASRFCAEG